MLVLRDSLGRFCKGNHASPFEFKKGHMTWNRWKLPDECKKIDPNIGYIIGTMLGDGNFQYTPQTRGSYYIRLTVKDKDFAEFFKLKLENWLKRKVSFFNHGKYFAVQLGSKEVYEYLKKLTEDFLWIKNTSNEIKAMILKGLFDSEGYVGKNILMFSNTNEKIIKLFKELCEYFNIKITIKKRNFVYKNRLPIFRVYITERRNILKFYKLIDGFTIQRKDKRFHELVSMYKYKLKDKEVLYGVETNRPQIEKNPHIGMLDGVPSSK
jgi:hypothetical protein